MIDTTVVQVNLNYLGNKKLLQEVKGGEKTYLEVSPYNNGERRKYLCYVGGVEPCGLFYNASLHYVCIAFHPKDFLGHYPTKEDSEIIMKSVTDFIHNSLGIPKDYIKSFSLNRIDYKNDFRFNNQIEREIIYNLMNKAPDTLGKVVKTDYATAISYAPKHRLCSSNYLR